jgi:hypothetical protein
MKPEAEEVRKAIVELLVVTEQLDEAVATVRAALKKRPEDAALYRELYDLFCRQHAFDKAWCVLDALAGLGVTMSREESRFHADFPPTPLAFVPGTLAHGAWRSHLVHRDLDLSLTGIFALILPAVLRARLAIMTAQNTKTKNGGRAPIDLGEPLSETGATSAEVLAAVADACEILGLSPPKVYERKSPPVPLAPTPMPPAMYASLESCEALTPDVLACVVAKRLAELRPELAARALFPSTTELTALLHTAVRIAYEEAPQKGRGAAAVFDRALHATITREERAALRVAVSSANARDAKVDVPRWARLADASTTRVALLLSGRVASVRRAMIHEPRLPGDLTPKEKLVELLMFAVSDEYSELRAAVGIGVGARPQE